MMWEYTRTTAFNWQLVGDFLVLWDMSPSKDSCNWFSTAPTNQFDLGDTEPPGSTTSKH